ncbi:Conserved_hypothetical protein [Hexamita inflata]|uniref:Fido domain-containing protein n=1 Tax=Hexamita inflata TaxID=28002 RepID=A0AA86P0G5_9EUKA|nr:Conserved hypothetical protein [Hexamita inflata]
MQRIEIPETDFIIEYYWDNEFDQIFQYIDRNLTKNYTETFRNTEKYNQTQIYQHQIANASLQCEKQQLQYKQWQKIDQYLFVNEIPNVDSLHNLIEPTCEFIRKSDVFIGLRQSYINFSCQHCGLNPEHLQELQIQNLVNWFYKNQINLCPIISFICYLLYCRIHPSLDGNGRMGRLLFLENLNLERYYPISFIIDILRDGSLQQLYNQSNFKLIKQNEHNIQYPLANEYYIIKLDKNYVKLIIKILLQSKLYTYLSSQIKQESKIFIRKFMRNPNCQKSVHQQNILDQLLDIDQYQCCWELL